MDAKLTTIGIGILLFLLAVAFCAVGKWLVFDNDKETD